MHGLENFFCSIFCYEWLTFPFPAFGFFYGKYQYLGFFSLYFGRHTIRFVAAAGPPSLVPSLEIATSYKKTVLKQYGSS